MIEEKRISCNGIPVYSIPNEHSHGFYISLFLKSGTMYEKDGECGITHFLEHALIRNVNSIMDGELYQMLDKCGMEFNASSYNEMVQFYISGNSGNFKIGAEIISRLLLPLQLSGEDIEAERNRIKAEIREADDKSSLAYFSSLEVWENTSLARPITGSLSDVSRIGSKKLEEYRKRVFTKENIFFYVTGNLSDDNLSYLLEHICNASLGCGDMHDNIAPVPTNFGKRPGEIKVKNDDFTKIRYTFDVDMNRVASQELDLLYDLVLGGYSSDFFIELSEKRGLFYDLRGTVEQYKNIGVFYFSYELKASKLHEAASKTMSLLKSYTERVLDADKCMRAGYVDNAYMLFDDSRELNFTFGYDNHVLELGYTGVEDRRNAYASITPERIREVAKEIFKPENLTVTLKCNKKKTDIDLLRKIIFEREWI